MNNRPDSRTGQDKIDFVRCPHNSDDPDGHGHTPIRGVRLSGLNDPEIDPPRLAKERTHTMTNTIIRLWGIDLHPTRPHQTAPERTCQHCVHCQRQREKRAQATAQAGGIESPELEQDYP